MTVENNDFFFASQFLKYVSELLVEPKILFYKKLSDFVETFTYFYQIPYPKIVKI